MALSLATAPTRSPFRALRLSGRAVGANVEEKARAVARAALVQALQQLPFGLYLISAEDDGSPRCFFVGGELSEKVGKFRSAGGKDRFSLRERSLLLRTHVVVDR